MKKFNVLGVCLIVAIIAMTGFAADVQAAKKDGIIVGWSNAGTRDSWRQFLLANFEAELANHPEVAEYYYTDADEKPEKQLADIEDLLTKGVDLLVVYPTSADAIIPAIEDAHDSGVPVIVFGGTIDTDYYTSLVGQDFVEFGKAGAKWLAEELGGKGKILLFSGIAGNSTAEDRLAGAKEVFAQYPDIEILDHQYTDWSIPKAKSIMETMIQAFPEIDGIWADSGLQSWPALQALQEAGRPLVPTTGDHLNGYAKFLVENDVPGFVYPITTKISAESLKVGLKAVKGEKVEKNTLIQMEGMGPEQIKEFVRPELSDFWWIGDDQMPEKFLPKF
ncbi:MAG: substrate-binding domain-containing protein [bacterium]|nr:substrate-binding domain-containing protein [bacterium]